MILKLRKTVAFVGMMGAGKTAIGRVVAQKLNSRFLDSDTEIELAANMSVSEIFTRDGEPFFRDREAEIIKRLLETETCILSTGGGAFENDEIRKAMSNHGMSLWLQVDLDLLWSRVKNKESRPLLNTQDPFGTLRDIFQERQDVYALADASVKANKDLSIDEMSDRVIDALLTRPDVLEQIHD
jgi:shikimate kinase